MRTISHQQQGMLLCRVRHLAWVLAGALCYMRCVQPRDIRVLWVQEFVRDAAFSEAALNLARITETEHATRGTVFSSAALSCDYSSGSMRIVRAKEISKMCWYANDYKRILRQVPRSKRSHDFVVCDRDCVQADTHVFALAKSRKIVDARNRTVSVLPVNVGRHFKWVAYAFRDPLPYDGKLPVALWRGVSTNDCWNLHPNVGKHLPECARRNLVTRWALDNSTKVDVGITEVVQVTPELGIRLKSLLKEPMKVKAMLKYKYLISGEGNDVATNLKWALASNSVVFMPPPTRESFILESKLKPWVHYVPLEHTMEDLEAKVSLCEMNRSRCRRISEAATLYMRAFSTRRKLFRLGAQVYEQHFRQLVM